MAFNRRAPPQKLKQQLTAQGDIIFARNSRYK